MIVYFLFAVSTIAMLVSLFLGALEVIVLTTLCTLITMVFFISQKPNGSAFHDKTAKTEEVVCIHTRLDCEECFSQNSCKVKDKNLVVERHGE